MPRLVDATPLRVAASDRTPPRTVANDRTPVEPPPVYAMVYMRSTPVTTTPVSGKPVESPPARGELYVFSSPFKLTPVGRKVIEPTPVSSAPNSEPIPLNTTPVDPKPVGPTPVCCTTHNHAKPLKITRMLKCYNKNLKAKDRARTVGRGTPPGTGEEGSISSDLHSGIPTSKVTDSAADRRVLQIRALKPRQRLQELREVLNDEVDRQLEYQPKKPKPVIQPGTYEYLEPVFTYVPNPLESRHIALEMKSYWFFDLLTREIMTGIHNSTQCRECRRTVARVGARAILRAINQDIKQSGLSKGRRAIQPVADYSLKMVRYGTGQRLSMLRRDLKGGKKIQIRKQWTQNRRAVAKGKK
ncbi:hypothetical protein LTR29_005633 [Friedmanniomyces endolithicus]|nr:hypothetical protein LTR29_005633 [Friedmanniomyces endolithicus]